MSVAPPVSGAVPAARYQIPAESLRHGMYVAELDRPWLDTPFLLQGFRIDSQIELETLRRYCRYVYVDPELSDAGLAETIRAAELTEAPFEPPAEPQPAGPLRFDTVLDEPVTRTSRATRPVRIRSDLKISNQTRERFRRFIKATAVAAEPTDSHPTLVDRAFGWLRGLSGNDPDTDAVRASLARARSAIRGQLPPEARLRRYADRASMDDELPRAREAFAHAERQLRALAEDVRAARTPDVQEFARAVDEVVDSMIDNPDALMWMAWAGEEGQSEPHHAPLHGLKVALFLVALGRQLGLPRRELAHLGTIGMLADIGKSRLPQALLEKPGMLTPSEYNVVKEHVRLGLEALCQNVRLAPAVEQGIAQHHERLDGSGYPKGLKGEEIGVYGRMAAIADTFAALIAARPYANAWAPQDALMSLYEWAGTSFDEPLVEQFVQAIGLFPVGSLVELSSGEMAVVLAHNRARRLEPRVMVLTGTDKSVCAPFERDLAARSKDREHRRIRIVRGLAVGAYGLRPSELFADGLAGGGTAA
ncbi:MAG: HD-GYP domain-containing protein [Burkholderiaceae bacterium]|nr:HD-GYP domain-containing protein [Burkholderiaceae bacterium]